MKIQQTEPFTVWIAVNAEIKQLKRAAFILNEAFCRLVM
jgi:hypothetical protein